MRTKPVRPKAGAKKYEGSALDERRDKKEAAKRGMTMKQYERTPHDAARDRAGQRKLNKAAARKKR